MTIQEAIKSGKPFYRTTYSGVRKNDMEIREGLLCYVNSTQIYPCLSKEDILADDWEVKQ